MQGCVFRSVVAIAVTAVATTSSAATLFVDDDFVVGLADFAELGANFGADCTSP